MKPAFCAFLALSIAACGASIPPRVSSPPPLQGACPSGPKPRGRAGAAAVTPDLAPHVPASHEVLARADGDLDGDGCSDVAVVLRDRADRHPETHALPRPLWLLVRRLDGTLHVAARNDHAVMRADDGGARGDPFAALRVGGGALTLHFQGGSAWQWCGMLVFRWERGARAWLLEKDISVAFAASEPEAARTETRTRRDFGRIRVESYGRDGTGAGG